MEDDYTLEPITAGNDYGEATFHRVGPNEFALDVTERHPERTILIDEHNLQELAPKFCYREIEATRQGLSSLGETLAKELHDDGDQVDTVQTIESVDSRTFKRDQATGAISAVAWENTTSLRGETSIDSASDRALVLAEFEALAQNRSKPHQGSLREFL